MNAQRTRNASMPRIACTTSAYQMSARGKPCQHNYSVQTECGSFAAVCTSALHMTSGGGRSIAHSG